MRKKPFVKFGKTLEEKVRAGQAATIARQAATIAGQAAVIKRAVLGER